MNVSALLKNKTKKKIFSKKMKPPKNCWTSGETERKKLNKDKEKRKMKKKSNNINKYFFTFTFSYQKIYILLENIFGKT